MPRVQGMTPNPYSTHRTWPPETHEAWRSLPTTADGMVKDLRYVPRGTQQDAYEVQWREWCRTHDRKWWPVWLFDWAAQKKRR